GGRCGLGRPVVAGRTDAPEPDVLHLDGHRRALVNLQGQHAAFRRAGGVVIDHIDRDPAVDDVGEAVADREDAVLVPVLGLDPGLDVLGLADGRDHLHAMAAVLGGHHAGHLTALGEDAPAAFLVQDAGVGLARLEVGLVPGDDRPHGALLRHAAAVLDAGVAVDDPVAQAELEVLDGAALPH